MRIPPLQWIVPLLALAVAAVSGATRPAPLGATVPRAVVLDIGQGDAILLDQPGDGGEVLIDGGPDPSRTLDRLRAHLGADRTIDLVVLTHPHADHVAGLADVLKAYDVARVLTTGVVHTTATYERFLTTVAAQHIPVMIAEAGQTYEVGAFHLEVIAPLAPIREERIANLNDASIVLRASVARADPAEEPARMLLTGDAEEEVEAAMLARWCADVPADAPCPALAADVLKAGHHGSETSSTVAFLRAVAPHHAIISVGAQNDYGHPHLRALRRLERAGASIWRTDRAGDVIVRFGPRGVDMVSERE